MGTDAATCVGPVISSQKGGRINIPVYTCAQKISGRIRFEGNCVNCIVNCVCADGSRPRTLPCRQELRSAVPAGSRSEQLTVAFHNMNTPSWLDYLGLVDTLKSFAREIFLCVTILMVILLIIRFITMFC